MGQKIGLFKTGDLLKLFLTGQEKGELLLPVTWAGGLIRQVTSCKKFNLYENFYDRTTTRWPFNTGDYLIEVTTWTGGLLRQVTSWKRINLFENFYDRTRKVWPFITGDYLIEVTTWTGGLWRQVIFKEDQFIWNFLWQERKKVTF